jgi:polyhydroxyalkanoate synthase
MGVPAIPAIPTGYSHPGYSHEGSWWPYWHKWLYRKSGPKVPARIPGDGALDIIEDAPGRYVKMK